MGFAATETVSDFFGRGVVLDAFERGATGEGRGDEESEHGAVGAAQREDGMRE